MIEVQRRALFALREALRLCEAAQYRVDGVLTEVVEVDSSNRIVTSHQRCSLNGLESFIAANPEDTRKFLGKAMPETRQRGVLSWRFRTAEGRVLRWTGESSAAWWAGDKPQTVPGYHLDFKSNEVWSVPV